MKTVTSFAAVFLCLLIAAVSPPSATADEHPQKAVLVTGASSGIGLKITERFAAEGHFVYAGARKPEDIERLSAMENVMGIRLDVTVQEEIDAAVELVRSEGRGLWGIINNAGVGYGAPALELDEDDLEFMLDVNVYGPYRVNKAFADLIFESGGRFSVISSISGVLSGPGYAAYSMSKHAMEAYTDSLAAEMMMIGSPVKVSAIEPGNFKSKIGDTGCARLLATGEFEKETRWPQYLEMMKARCTEERENPWPEPDAVAEAALHAMFDDNPKEHYMVVPEQVQAEITIRKAIEEVVRLNEGHDHSYSKEDLLKMLEDEVDTGDAYNRAISRLRN